MHSSLPISSNPTLLLPSILIVGRLYLLLLLQFFDSNWSIQWRWPHHQSSVSFIPPQLLPPQSFTYVTIYSHIYYWPHIPLSVLMFSAWWCLVVVKHFVLKVRACPIIFLWNWLSHLLQHALISRLTCSLELQMRWTLIELFDVRVKIEFELEYLDDLKTYEESTSSF